MLSSVYHHQTCNALWGLCIVYYFDVQILGSRAWFCLIDLEVNPHYVLVS
jgi:hypothetical protein